jgi:hypothetical protein
MINTIKIEMIDLDSKGQYFNNKTKMDLLVEERKPP